MSDSPDQKIAAHAFDTFKAQNYPKLSASEAFERFAVEMCIREYNPSGSDIEDGIVSGKDDGGIDSFHIFLNRSELLDSRSVRLTRQKKALVGLQAGFQLDVVILQSKKETSWDTNVFPKIESALKELLDDKVAVSDLRSFPLNNDIIEKATIWRQFRSKTMMLAPVVNFHVIYVSFGRQKDVVPYMTSKANQLRKWLETVLPSGSGVSVEYVGDSAIVERLRGSADFVASLRLTKLPIRETNALVGLVAIRDYLKFLRREKSTVLREELFAANVRDYAGSNVRVNDAIVRTLAQDSETLFWWLNNGITIIADKAEDPLELEWLLTNPLIVNGLQTSHVLHESDLAAGGITKKRMKQSVLVRVITESNPIVREAIIAGTNNQTAIASLQLHANEEKQVRIEEFLRASGWFYERRRYQHRGSGASASKIRNIGELGQAVMAFRLLQPDTARARPASLLGVSAGWKRVFDPSEPEDLYLSALDLVEFVDDYLRSGDAKAIADDATNARYYLVSGWSLWASGVKKLADYEKVPTSSLKSTPTATQLEAVHKLLHAEVRNLDDGKTAVDRVFKGNKLKPAFFNSILAQKKMT